MLRDQLTKEERRIARCLGLTARGSWLRCPACDQKMDRVDTARTFECGCGCKTELRIFAAVSSEA